MSVCVGSRDSTERDRERPILVPSPKPARGPEATGGEVSRRAQDSTRIQATGRADQHDNTRPASSRAANAIVPCSCASQTDPRPPVKRHLCRPRSRPPEQQASFLSPSRGGIDVHPNQHSESQWLAEPGSTMRAGGQIVALEKSQAKPQIGTSHPNKGPRICLRRPAVHTRTHTHTYTHIHAPCACSRALHGDRVP